MLRRLSYGVCGVVLVCSIVKKNWQDSTISPYSLVGVPHAHEQYLNGKGVVVAVLDECFDSSHTFLKDNFSSIYRYNTTNKKSQDVSETLIFEDGKYGFESHGTHVSGIITSLASEVKIIPIKIEGFGG